MFVGAGFFLGNLPTVKHNFTLVVLGIVVVRFPPQPLQRTRTACLQLGMHRMWMECAVGHLCYEGCFFMHTSGCRVPSHVDPYICSTADLLASSKGPVSPKSCAGVCDANPVQDRGSEEGDRQDRHRCRRAAKRPCQMAPRVKQQQIIKSIHRQVPTSMQ